MKLFVVYLSCTESGLGVTDRSSDMETAFRMSMRG